MEKWKRVENFPSYEISNYGAIRSVDSYHKRRGKQILKPWDNGNGYLMVTLCSGAKKRRHTTINRLVAETFIPNIENKPQVNHKNGDKKDNFYLNLEWVTDSENKLHAYHNGLMPYRGGEDCHLSRFTEDDIRAMRQIYRDDPNMTYVELGEKFHTSGSTARKIILKLRWKHVE